MRESVPDTFFCSGSDSSAGRGWRSRMGADLGCAATSFQMVVRTSRIVPGEARRICSVHAWRNVSRWASLIRPEATRSTSIRRVSATAWRQAEGEMVSGRGATGGRTVQARVRISGISTWDRVGPARVAMSSQMPRSTARDVSGRAFATRAARSSRRASSAWRSSRPEAVRSSIRMRVSATARAQVDSGTSGGINGTRPSTVGATRNAPNAASSRWWDRQLRKARYSPPQSIAITRIARMTNRRPECRRPSSLDRPWPSVSIRRLRKGCCPRGLPLPVVAMTPPPHPLPNRKEV